MMYAVSTADGSHREVQADDFEWDSYGVSFTIEDGARPVAWFPLHLVTSVIMSSR